MDNPENIPIEPSGGKKSSDSISTPDKARERASDPSGTSSEDVADSAKQIDNYKKERKSEQKPQNKGLKKSTIWTIKITVITLFLSAFFSFVSELASTKANIGIMVVLLFFLIALSIAADAVGVAATSCDLAPLLSMASRKEPGSKQAIMLVKNAERVSNICCDVIGDICSIISGACALAIVIKVTENMGETLNMVISVLMSGVVSALTVGGKSMFKNVAITNSKELILLTARVLSVFTPKDKKERPKDKGKQ